MSRHAMHNPEDPNMEQAIDRADHAKKEARENGPVTVALNPAALGDLYAALAGMVSAIDGRPDIGRLFGFKEWAEHARATAALAKANRTGA